MFTVEAEDGEVGNGEAGGEKAGGEKAGDWDLSPVEIEGKKRVVVSGTDDFPRATRTCTVECASGVRATDTWTGVPIASLVERANFPGETTHLRVESDDFVADAPIRTALDGILAFDRREGREEEQTELGLPRFVARELPGERLVKRVRRISAVELAPDEDPVLG